MKRQVLEVLSGKGNTSALTTNDLFILVNETTEITDVFVTGGTYSSGTTVFTNNTGGTFNVTGFYVPSATTAYKVFTALLTQSGGDNPTTTLGDEILLKGITYEITEDTVVDMIKYGAPNNNIGTKFICNQEITDWGRPSNVINYNSGAPIATVLENTIGNIWFIYGATGSYSIISDNLFTNNKTTTFGSQYNGNLGVYIYFATGGSTTSSEIPIQVGDPSPSDGYLVNTPIEIRVYN